MSTIVTRTGKGSALTVAEMDSNLTNLNTDKLELDDISVTTGAGGETSALSYNNSTGVFTFTPNTTADLAALDDFSVTTGAGAETSALSYNNTTGVFTFTPVTTADLAALDDFSVTTVSASSGGALAYNNTTGVFTFTPADLSGASLTGITDNATGSVITIGDDDTVISTNLQVSSGHNIDLVAGQIGSSLTGGNVELATDNFGTIVLNSNNIQIKQNGTITAGGTNNNLNLKATGTGSLVITDGAGINLKAASNIFTDTAATDIDITSTGQLNLNSLTYFDAGIQEAIHNSTTTSGTYAPDATDGSIHYVALSGSMTINGFNNVAAGQTITLFFDGTGGSYTLTLGASILTPGGSLALTSGGYDIVTITCIDDTTPVYVATAINNFQ